MGKPNTGNYAQQPFSSAKTIAGTNPLPGPVTGTDVTTLVPWKKPRITGLEGAHGFGHLIKHRKGHLRLSGHPKGHRIGAVPKGTTRHK